MGRARHKSFKRTSYAIARVVHVYLSMAMLFLLLLFCITGITLNHSAWFKGGSSDSSIDVALPSELTKVLREPGRVHFENPPLAEIQSLLLDQYHLQKVSDIRFDEYAEEIVFDYKLPAGYATAIVNVSDATLVLEYHKGSFWLLVNDLHKGRHSGDVWSWVIDVSAALMILFSIAGLIILFQNNKYRKLGLILLGLGMMTPFVFYWFFVPRITGVS